MTALSRNALSPAKYNQVKDRFKRRIRCLWFRDGAYFAQLRVDGKVKQTKLHSAVTIPKAQATMQDLKGRIARGEYPPKSEGAVQQTEQVAGDHSIPAAITKYRAERDVQKKEDPKTRARKDSGLNMTLRFTTAGTISSDTPLWQEPTTRLSRIGSFIGTAEC